jgi:hypothetical protein
MNDYVNITTKRKGIFEIKVLNRIEFALPKKK